MIRKSCRFAYLLVAVLTALACSSFGQTAPTFTRTDLLVGSESIAVASADFNGDGKPDLAVLALPSPGTPTAAVSILLGNGDGTFRSAPIPFFFTVFVSGWLIAADLNHDNRPDLVVANSFARSISVFLGNGDGTFGPRADISLPGRVDSVIAADFNHDGNLDLAAPNLEPQPYTVSVLLGNGDGTFGPHSEFPTLDVPDVVTADDFNADGKLDLAINGLFGGVSVLLGNGDGTFQSRKDLSTGSTQTTDVVSADFNGDGKPDLAVANDADNSVSILLGNGDGTFSLQPPLPVSVTPWRVASRDINLDGKTDLVVALADSAKVSVFPGNGDGTFGTARDFETGLSPRFVLVTDLNGDGKLDLVTANEGDGTITILLNTTPAGPSITLVSPTSGTQGQTIATFTVNGSNFDPNATLSFSGTGITVSSYGSRTPTQIIASITLANNALVGTQDVIVTNADGQRAVLPTAFQVIPAVPPIPGPPPPPSGIGPGNLPVSQQAVVSEPISTGNGNYYYTHNDFIIPGRGMPLIFQRSYNTLDNYAGPLGVNWTHSYNAILTGTSTGVINIRWGDGHGETFTPSGNGYNTQPGVFSTLVRYPDSTFLLTRKDQTQYAFSSLGKLTSIGDRNGNTILLTYDANGNLLQITDAVGRAISLTYDANGHITQVKDPAGRTNTFQYSTTSDLVAATDPASGTTQFAYDANHHVTSIIKPTGQTLLQNTYDLAGRVVSQTNGRNAATSIAYDVPNIGDRTITDARGNQTIHTYDGSLRIVKMKDALLGTTSFSYDANNDRTALTNPAGETTNFAYDSRGNLTGITDPLGDTTGFTYDSRNDPLIATNAKGNTTAFSYDGNSNLVGILGALGGQTTFNYDGFGELTSKTDARGNATSFTYDGSGNLARITDALGNETALAYDSISRLTSITDPNGHAASAFYDALSRLVKISDPLGNQTKFAYDAAGNLTQIIDAKGNATAYAYDAVNNLVKVTDALGRITQYGYDGNNNRVTFTNAKSKMTSYGYDAINRLLAVTDPLGFTTSYAYDALSNVTGTTDANGRTNQFTYDALNRLIGISYADGKTVSYAYDANGNRTSMTDSHGATTYNYDALDRLASVVHPGSKTVAYGYDAAGNRVSLTYPDGKLSTYGYDASNRLSRATDWLARATNYTYDRASNLSQILYPTGARLAFSYDAANRLQQVANAYQGSLGNPISSFTYLLDAVGNRLKVTDGSGKATSYGYDALNELKSVTVGTSVTNFTYDAVGNRLTLTAPSTSINYSYDAADRLLAAGGTTFAYDKNGNQITKTPPNSKPLAFAYDAANRLISVLGGKTNSAFAYDGDGNRINQTVGSGTYSYVNDVAASLPVALQESGPDGNIAYAYGLGLISESGPGFDYFYHYDGLGSVVGLTDAGTKLAGRYSYDAWGQTDTSIPDTQIGTKNKFRFTGEALDPGTGLYYLRARYYDSSVGRLLTRDPLAGSVKRPPTLNRYAYALNNPALLSDPSGLSSLDSTRITINNSVLGYLGESVKALAEDIGEELVPPIAVKLSVRGVITSATAGTLGAYAPLVSPIYSLVQSTQDAINHPERGILEDFERGSIDLAVNTTITLGSVFGGPAGYGLGFFDSVVYNVNREQIQNDILENYSGWLWDLVAIKPVY